MSDDAGQFVLASPVRLSGSEKIRLTQAITEVLTNFDRFPHGDLATFHDLEAARLLAERGSYHYEAMSSLLAKQIFFLATLATDQRASDLLAEALKAHLDVREPA